jgi:hypothetical protein
MSNAPSPLEKLDDAIRTYSEECGDDGVVSAWALSFETQQLSADERLLPLQHATAFVMGPSTSPAAAIGLLELGSAYVRDHAAPQDEDPDDDDVS